MLPQNVTEIEMPEMAREAHVMKASPEGDRKLRTAGSENWQPMEA